MRKVFIVKLKTGYIERDSEGCFLNKKEMVFLSWYLNWKAIILLLIHSIMSFPIYYERK